jgi:hypothetical protein
LGAVLYLSPAWLAMSIGTALCALFIVGSIFSFDQGLYWQALFRLVVGIAGVGLIAKGLANSQPSRPLGFQSQADFAVFTKTLTDGLDSAGINDASVAFRGSSVTGSSREGQPFDLNRVSDYDLAIASKTLFGKAKSIGVQIRGGGTRTQPLDPENNPSQLKSLGLYDTLVKLNDLSGRDCSIMIYDSVDPITSRGDAMFVSGD